MVHKDIKVGEKVYAKWPGSIKYYEASVDEVLEDGFVVTFSEGSLSASLDEKHVYKTSYFDHGRGRSASSPARRSRSPGRRKRSRSRSPGRRSTSTPKKSPKSSPTRRGRSPGRPRKQAKEEPKEEPQETKEEPKPQTPGRGRPRKQVAQEAAEQTPVKTKITTQVQQSTVTHLTRSMTKSLVKEEKEALFDTEKLEQEMKESKARKKGKEFEFGGPVGVFFMILALPVIVYATYFYCHGENNKCSFRNNPIKLPHWRVFFDKAHLYYDAFLLFQVLLYFVPFGKVVQGPTFPDGTRKTFRMNGLLAFVATVAALFLLKAKQVPLKTVYDGFPSLITAALIWSLIFSIFVYVKARREGTNLSVPGNTGNTLYDFFMGHQFYPSLGKFDFKVFCKSRPGLLGWMVINFCMANQQFETFGKVSPAMMMVCFFQMIYVLDFMIFEAAVFSQLDMTHDGFGFMLSFGDLVLVPFVFSIQARYLADHQVQISWPFIVAIVILKVVGYVIFRGSNLQKDFFRQQPDDPDFQDKETILTPSGKRLMVFGWWKMVRHPNYLGDILMAISWSFTCGFDHIIPWLYPIYLIIFLFHRERRDEALCRKKYGKSYDEYCRRVPYRIVPLVY